MKRLRARTAFGLGCRWFVIVALLAATSWSQLACACSSGLGCASHKAPQSAVATKCSCCGDSAEQAATEAAGCCSKKPEAPKSAAHGCCSAGHAATVAVSDANHATLSTPSCVCSVQTPDRPAFPGREQDKVQPAKRVNDELLPMAVLTAEPAPTLASLVLSHAAGASPAGACPTPVLLCTFRC